MSKPRISLKKPRNRAFNQQQGLCYYCGTLMWAKSPKEVISKLKVTKKQAESLMCTGEHLTAHRDGGDDSYENIVAACLYCNQKRHKRKDDLSPVKYKALVKRRLEKGRWRNW